MYHELVAMDESRFSTSSTEASAYLRVIILKYFSLPDEAIRSLVIEVISILQLYERKGLHSYIYNCPERKFSRMREFPPVNTHDNNKIYS